MRVVKSAWQDGSIYYLFPEYDWADIFYIINVLAKPCNPETEKRRFFIALSKTMFSWFFHLQLQSRIV